MQHVAGISTHAIYVDCNTELINKDLNKWCPLKEIEIQLTTLYTVAECMNRTLEELAHAKFNSLLVSKLPEFLWKPAVDTAHVRNRAYTITSIEGQTLYQGWYGTKPNVSHLCKSSESSKGRISPEKSCSSLATRLCQIQRCVQISIILQRHFGVFKTDY